MAIVLTDYNACFLHCPKTGGMWIEQALKNSGIKTEWAPCSPGIHFRHAAKGMLLEKYDQYFTFVRRPAAWYRSWWMYYFSVEGCERGRWTVPAMREWHPMHSMRPLMTPQFDLFIERSMTENTKFLSWLYRLYVGPPESPEVDYVGRQEHLFDDLVAILDRIGVEYDLEKLKSTEPVNQSSCLFGRPEWNPDLRKRIKQVEAETVKRFYRDDLRSGEFIESIVKRG